MKIAKYLNVFISPLPPNSKQVFMEERFRAIEWID
jgi:hypothetical protein